MQFYILIGFALFGIVWTTSMRIPDADKAILEDLVKEADNARMAYTKQVFDTFFLVAQSIIDANEAPKYVLDDMRDFLRNWRGRYAGLNYTEFERGTAAFMTAFSKENLYATEQKERFNLYTNFRYERIAPKAEEEAKNIMNNFVTLVIEKVKQLSQTTKDSQPELMDKYNYLVNSKNFSHSEPFEVIIEIRSILGLPPMTP